MKVLKWILIVVVALGALLLIGGALLPSKFTVARSAVIDAPPDKVYALVASPRQWTQWSVWNRRDPAMKVDYAGPDSGTGAKWNWQSKSQGDGSMTFTAAEPPRRVAYELYFPDFGTTSAGDLALSPEGSNGTRITWTMNGDMGKNPLFHWMALFADDMVGKDFEGGLANLKAVAEKP
ncbi:MAG TPA: SRPBCC family protein [Albitalea sp.]|nr:SRPBCC family protein [Albitalea sp.]